MNSCCCCCRCSCLLPADHAPLPPLLPPSKQSLTGAPDSVPRRYAAAHPGQERPWLPTEFPYKPVAVRPAHRERPGSACAWLLGLLSAAEPPPTLTAIRRPCTPLPALPRSPAAAQAGQPLRLRPVRVLLRRVLHARPAARWGPGCPAARHTRCPAARHTPGAGACRELTRALLPSPLSSRSRSHLDGGPGPAVALLQAQPRPV